jgi:hypothetical protein
LFNAEDNVKEVIVPVNQTNDDVELNIEDSLEQIVLDERFKKSESDIEEKSDVQPDISIEEI